jgi:hypothetical protein
VILPSGIYQQIPLNTSEVPQSDLNIENKFRSNPLAWNGQFSPQLIQVLLRTYAKPEMTVFDPFLGSGTVLLEAGRAGLAASGTEINPAAIVLSQTYKFINVTHDLRRLHLNAIQRLLHREFPDNLPLFQNSEGSREELDAEAVKSRLSELIPTVEERLQYQLLETLVALLDFYRPGLSVDRVLTTWSKLSRLVIELPYSQEVVDVYHADARKTPLPSFSIDLVITSPPYINVFNYHQRYRASMEALNWNLLKVARSEIGSNRKHRANRFLTVTQYCLDLSQTFYEMARVCRPKSRLVFIVGRESTIKNTKFFNGELVAEIAHRALGFDLILRQERVFLNRFGQSIFEDILHFSPPTGDLGSEFLADARAVAKDVLEKTYLVAPDEAKEYLKLAIERIEVVKPSPIFNLPDFLGTQ